MYYKLNNGVSLTRLDLSQLEGRIFTLRNQMTGFYELCDDNNIIVHKEDIRPKIKFDPNTGPTVISVPRNCIFKIYKY